MKIEKIVKKHNIKTNSKDIEKGDIFFCTLGNEDKTKYIPDAIKRGCYLVVNKTDFNYKTKKIICQNINDFLIKALEYKYNYPLDNKRLIGVTGTDGKTTTVAIIKDMLDASSIGTNGVILKDTIINTNNTTPSIEYLYQYFSMIKSDIVMEVSSEAYLTKRIPNLFFDIGIFLNISKEHLDKHINFDNYLLCKKELLKNSNIRIINHDSKYFKLIVKDINNYLTIGKKKSDLQIIKYKLDFNKTIIWFKYNNKIYRVISPLLGQYNVYNLGSSILCLLALNYDINSIIERIKMIKTIPGRMERFIINNKMIIIDYAHTINATKEVLKFIKKHSKKKIITIVGCAGGRYKEKRKKIGWLVLKYSKKVFFTMDDPRWEKPIDIVHEMIGKSKKKNYTMIINRRLAIIEAFKEAKKDDLILILGKGRDTYMAIQDDKVLYSDIWVLSELKSGKMS